MSDEWRTIKGIDEDDVRVVVRSKLLYTFTDPAEVLRRYRAGKMQAGCYAANRPGELPGSTEVEIILK